MKGVRMNTGKLRLYAAAAGGLIIVGYVIFTVLWPTRVDIYLQNPKGAGLYLQVEAKLLHSKIPHGNTPVTLVVLDLQNSDLSSIARREDPSHQGDQDF